MVKRPKSRSPTDSRFDLLATPTPEVTESMAESTTRDSPAENLEMLLTPPTSVSVSNAPSEIDTNKALVDLVADVDVPPEVLDKEPTQIENRRKSVRSRNNVATYSDKYLSGHAVHTRKSYRKEGDIWSSALANMDSLKRTVSGVTLVNDDADSPSKQLLSETNKALDSEDTKSEQAAESSMVTRRKSVRASVSNLVNAVASSNLGKRGRDAFEATKGRITRSTAPKPVKASPKGPPARKRMFPNLPMPESDDESSEEESEEEEEEEEEEVVAAAKRPKKFWMSHGLYVGQERVDDRNIKGKGRKSETAARKERRLLPLPMFTGMRLLEIGRDFKLPYDILNPLPKPEHPKDWRNITKNRFVGDASASWNRDKEEWTSCQCKPWDGCHEGCLNRVMRYECNNNNCTLGERCTNRNFAELKWRKEGKNFTRNPVKKESNMWGEGIEVMKTDSRGHGVRAMRSFEPGQIIVEYTGEIITQNEADRRMNNEYKEHSNYYMMTFHDGLIIDGYKGSICRFVNHSCEPNCIVEKWTVDNQPRMALFAGPRPIDVGEEITYDYNFAPFSDDSTQQCRCGAPSCRGVLGPRPSERIITKAAQASAAKALASIANVFGGAKRKLLGGSVPGTPNKRRKLTPLTPNDRNKNVKMDPRTKAAPAVEPPSKQLAEMQQLSRAFRAEKRALEEKRSRSGRALRERHSVHTFPVPNEKPTKQVVPVKRRGHSLASSAVIRNVINSAKKKSSAIADRASAQKSSMLGLPKASTRAVSGSSSTSRLLNKSSQAGLRQSRLSLNGSTLSVNRAPDTPTGSLRQSGRVHKPSPKYLAAVETIKPKTKLAVATKVSSTKSQKKEKARESAARSDAYWDISASEPDEDQEVNNETPDDSPGLRLSKRQSKPSSRMAEIIASGEKTVSKRARSSLSESLTASFRNVADAASVSGSVKKARAMLGGSKHAEKTISKTMRKISGAP